MNGEKRLGVGVNEPEHVFIRRYQAHVQVTLCVAEPTCPSRDCDQLQTLRSKQFQFDPAFRCHGIKGNLPALVE